MTVTGLSLDEVPADEKAAFLNGLADFLIEGHKTGNTVSWSTGEVGYSPGDVFRNWESDLQSVLSEKGCILTVKAAETHMWLSSVT